MSDTKVSQTVFKDNHSTVFFVSRGQKIASAIYLVTELFDEREPLKWTLRSNVLDFVFEVSQGSQSVSDRLGRIMFMLETATRVRLMSEMNRDILVSETRSFLNAFESELRGKANAESRSVSDILGEVKETPQISYQSSLVSRPQRQMYIKGQSRGPIKDIHKDALILEPQKHLSTGKDRKEKITNIIREKGEITIKDIASSIPDCSEKTIQRDLVDLVLAGTIKKKGERRWTVYFL